MCATKLDFFFCFCVFLLLLFRNKEKKARKLLPRITTTQTKPHVSNGFIHSVYNCELTHQFLTQYHHISHRVHVCMTRLASQGTCTCRRCFTTWFWKKRVKKPMQLNSVNCVDGQQQFICHNCIVWKYHKIISMNREWVSECSYVDRILKITLFLALSSFKSHFVHFIEEVLTSRIVSIFMANWIEEALCQGYYYFHSLSLYFRFDCKCNYLKTASGLSLYAHSKLLNIYSCEKE